MKPPLPLLALVVALLACGGREPSPPTSAATAGAAGSGPLFADRAAETGLDFVHFNGMVGRFDMLEILGPGVALLDYDGDGDLDVYLVQGGLLRRDATLDDALGEPRHPVPLTDRLYRNDLEAGPGGERRLRFTDVTAEAGLAPLGHGMGVAVGDFDNDGDVDLYRTALRGNTLLANRGDGTFADVTAAAGAGDPRVSVPAVFFDYDLDGWLDLFVGNYVELVLDDPPRCRDVAGGPDYCGPASFPSLPDRLLRNRGDGTFEDVTVAAGLSGGFGPALGALAADFDGDGWSDLYVANDGAANNLWRNRGDGTFEDVALLAGAAVNRQGSAEGSMGVDAADFDGDGDLDLFMTHLSAETNTLYVNDGRGMFEDATSVSGLGAPSRLFTGFGTAWFDVDNDGRPDLLSVNGAVTKIEALARRGDPFPLHQTNQLFHNLGRGEDGAVRFEEVTDRAGDVFRLSEVSRGAAFGDLDNDGDTDVVVTNNDGPVRLLVNLVGQDRPWLGLRLVTGSPPRDALGARAAVLVDGEPRLWRHVRTAASYASASDPRLLFGLGGTPAPEGVLVHWPGGRRERFNGLALGRYHTLVEGSGTPAGEGGR